MVKKVQLTKCTRLSIMVEKSTIIMQNQEGRKKNYQYIYSLLMVKMR